MQIIKVQNKYTHIHTHTSKANTRHLTFEKITYIYDEARKDINVVLILC